MSFRHIAIVGTGGIGQRHLQSCGTLPPQRYRIHAVDPSEKALEAAAELLCNRNPEFIQWHATPATLPAHLDAVVVATNADVRAKVVRAVTGQSVVRHWILEKVLFQRLEEYQEVWNRVAKTGSVWVNCPQRLYPSYVAAKDWLAGRDLLNLSVGGADWDIGCNAIHFLDLFAFLSDGDTLDIDATELTDVRPAKRGGNLHLEGQIAGRLTSARGRTVPFRVSSSPDGGAERIVCIESSRGPIVCTARAGEITTGFPDGTERTDPVPYQSQMTASVIESLLDEGQCGLPSYEVSRRLHEPMIRAYLQALAARGDLTEPDRCPIT